MHQSLQCALKPYKRACGLKHWHSRYSDNRSIHERPKLANARGRRGDWEGDTMYGAQDHLVTLVDRRSRFFPARCTLSLDNGVGFTDHKRIEEKGSTKIYFADPYASWQRGSNEDANSRLRRWIPRSVDLSKLTPQRLLRIIEGLNKQPRKCLEWKAPYEVHHNVSVAVIV